MSLKRYPASASQLWRKLEREAYRAFHARSRPHKEDHFFNFCVTANAMRDYFLESVGASTQRQRAPYYEAWGSVPVLVAAKEIGNLSKHFTLRDPPKTRAVRRPEGEFADIYLNDAGEVFVSVAFAPDIVVILSDGTQYELHQFTAEVLGYWRDYLRRHGARVRRQTVAELLGARASQSPPTR